MNELFALLRFEIKETELCNDAKNSIEADTLTNLYILSKRHDLAHLVGDALDKNGLLPDNSEAKKRLLQERNMAVYRYEQMQYEFEQICVTLEEAKIPFIPLKGSVIRALYPEPWMRTSCDIDILVKEEDLLIAVKELEETLKYHSESKGNHDVSLFAESGVHLELHYKLNDSGQAWDSILTKVWEYSEPKAGFQCILMNEMLYFYHIAHMERHFKVGGCGVRSFLDLYFLRKSIIYNKEILTNLLKQGGLLTFNEAVCALSDYWFAGGEASPMVQDLQRFVLNAGMYGDMKNRVAIARAKKGGTLKVLWSRIFLPYDRLKFQYPRLQKFPILYPFYIVKRWFKLLKKADRERAVQELNETKSGDKERQAHIARLLKDLDL